MIIYEQVKVSSKLAVGYKCDVCKKYHAGKDYPNSWHYFNSQHGDWENDNCESVNWHLVCSVECYTKQLKKCLSRNELGDRETTGEVDGFCVPFAKELLIKLNK